MSRIRLIVPMLLLVVFLASAPAVLAHWDAPNTGRNMSVLIMEATLDDEFLAIGDEVGAFTPAGVLGGALVISQDERANGDAPAGISVWGDDPDDNQGVHFRPNEQIAFKIWDSQADEEWNAEITEVIQGEAIYAQDSFVLLNLAAVRERAPNIEVSENEHNFGAVRLTRSATWELTVMNTGSADLTVENMFIEEEVFSVNFEGEFTLAPDASREFTVTFAPEAVQEYSSDLLIRSDDPDQGEIAVRLIGTGEAANPPAIALSNNDRRFGRVVIGQSRNLSIFVSNEGDEELVVSEVSVGNDAFHTDFDDQVGIAVAGGERAEIVITFAPEAAGVFETELAIGSNDPDDGNINIPLSGEGIEEGEDAVASIMAEQHFYGAVTVGRTATWRMVVTNIGGSDLHVTGVSTDNEAFQVEFGNDAVRLRPGDYLYVNTSFTPGEAMWYDGMITVASDDPANGEISVPVAGVGLANDRHFLAWNTGINHTLLITAATLDGNALGEGVEVGVFTEAGLCAGFGTFNADGQAGIAAYGDEGETEAIDGFMAEESFSFMVWDPNARTEAWGTPDFENGPETYETDGVSVLTLAALTGDPMPDIALSEMNHFYGQVQVNTGEDWVLTISNQGRGTLTVSAIDADLNAYTTDFEGSFSLELGESRDITVTFAPENQIDFEGRLTIVSDDPMDSLLYVDLFGVGVDEVREPVIGLSDPNHFFGVQHLNVNAVYTLNIRNDGGGLMRLENVVLQGSNTFTTNWPGNPRNINPGESFDVQVTFRAPAAQTYAAELVITSDDPNNGVVRFPMEGTGSAAQDHFLHRQTQSNHSLIVTEAIIRNPIGDFALAPGDEIAVFTPGGLCAGHLIVPQNQVYNFSAWGDDANTVVADGFLNNEGFTFKFWDISTRQELDVEATHQEGPEGYQAQGRTVYSRLLAVNDVVEAQIAVDPPIFQFGAVRLQTNAQHVFHIQNTGGVDLTVTRITSNMNAFTHDFNNQAVVIEPGEQIDVTVTFRPVQASAYEGIITVFSDDPDQAQFIFRPNGMGSNQRGHYDWMVTGSSMSLLCSDFTMGGAPASGGDEIAAFTPDGMCAGSGTVDPAEPGVCGLPAWGDDNETEYLDEGFDGDDAITIKVWDASQGREYSGDDLTLDVVQGPGFVFGINDFTVFTLNVEGVFSVRYDPIPVPDAEEDNDVVDIDFDLINAPNEDMAFSWLNPEVIGDARGDVSFTDNGDNTATFHWEPNLDAVVGEARHTFTIRIQATDGETPDLAIVPITIINVNQAPIVANPFQGDRLTVDEDQWEIGGNPNRVDTLVLVQDLNQLFNDLDGNAMTFSPVSVDPLMYRDVRQRPNNQGLWKLRVVPGYNFNVDLDGEIEVTVRADDRQQQQMGPDRDLRSVGGEQAIGMEVSNGQGGLLPGRDATTDYTFTVVIRPVNDTARIVTPSANQVFNVNERAALAPINFTAQDTADEEAGDDFDWTIVDRDGLPDAAVFTDNNDGTATLVWDAPQRAHIRQYRPTIRLNDLDGGQGTIGLTVRIVINVLDVREPPVIEEEIPDMVGDDGFVEDVFEQRPVPLATLNDGHWSDPEGGNMTYGFMPLGRGTTAPAAVRLAYNAQTTILTMDPIANYNTGADGFFTVRVFARDATADSTFMDFNVSVRAVNDAPVPVGRFAFPIGRREGQVVQRQNIAGLLSIRFNDPDTNALVYTVAESSPDSLRLQIDGVQLSFFPTPDFNTSLSANQDPRNDSIYTIVATDPSGESAMQIDTAEVIPDVNDLPSAAFDIISPLNGAHVGSDDEPTATFAWDSTFQQTMFDDDSVLYVMKAWPEISPRDSLVLTLPNDRFIYDIPLGDIMERPNVEDTLRIHWQVFMIDRAGVRVQSRSGEIVFFLDPLEIRELPNAGTPEQYYISDSYPNPFNARTTLKFGMPVAGNVDVTVWDMHGRKVAELAGGYHQAGEYELVWTADGMTSGIYLIKMQSGQYVGMKKAILVR